MFFKPGCFLNLEFEREAGDGCGKDGMTEKDVKYVVHRCSELRLVSCSDVSNCHNSTEQKSEKMTKK